MGKTQAAFAVEVLKTAVTTIARYETNGPPRGEVLLRLRDIAQGQGLLELSSKFELLYIDDVLKNLGSRLTMVPATRTEPARGFLIMSLSARAIGPARTCMRLLSLMNSDQKIRPEIDKASSSLNEELTKDDDLVRKQIDQAMISAVTGQAPPTEKTKGLKRERTAR
jgi:hypothetical protein